MKFFKVTFICVVVAFTNACSLPKTPQGDAVSPQATQSQTIQDTSSQQITNTSVPLDSTKTKTVPNYSLIQQKKKQPENKK